MILRLILAVAALPLANAAATSQPSKSLEGWWRAELTHGGDKNEMFISFERRGDKLVSYFSIPAITADKSPLGHVTIDGDNVKITEPGWTLTRSADGNTLTAVLPHMLVPTYDIPARFERSAVPVQPPSPSPVGAAPEPMWTAALGAPVIGGLSSDASGRIVYAATKAGRVVALSSRTGRILWSTDLGAAVRAAPRFSSGGLFVASDEAVHKLDLATGKPLWARSIGKPLKPVLDVSDPNSRWDHYSASPVLASGKVYVGSRDGCLYAFSASSGAPSMKACAKDAITATPVVNGGRVFFGSFDHKLYAVDATTGKVAWIANLGEAITRDLALSVDKVVAGSRSYDLRAFDAASGDVAWNRYVWFSWIDSAPVVSGPMLAIGSSDAQRVFAMNAQNGRPMWSAFLGGWSWGKPALAARTVFAGAVGTSMDYVGKRTGGFAALDRRTGELRWLYKPGHDPKALIWGFAADPLVVGRAVIAADLAGKVYAFPAN